MEETKLRLSLPVFNDPPSLERQPRTTADKYLHTVVEQGGLVRHGRCGIFPDQRNNLF
ncbi:DUF977 family protein [Enterobacter asburiae]|uniref:DUF977 family protein n=1 Tax=Enterobacter asburiae TaxID=61645 RepID=UPI003D218A22